MGAEAKLYLQEHSIPQLFEGLMTGLIYNKPDDPIAFLENALARIRADPTIELAWDMFVDKDLSKPTASHSTAPPRNNEVKKKTKRAESRGGGKHGGHSQEDSNKENSSDPGRESKGKGSMAPHRAPSVMKAAEVARIPDVPIILFMGGPGGGKTRHAARVFGALAEQGLVHICMPDVIRAALTKYKDRYPEWREANERYMRGQLIPNNLALALVKAEMARHPEASAYFLEGFPREARQVEDFERQVKTVNMALILDYDERTLREHMERRGLGLEIIEQKIKEFKQKTLPSAKYFDDQKLLHLIPGEKDDQYIFERMKSLVLKAMESGVPVINSNLQGGEPMSPGVAQIMNALPASPPPLNGEVNGKDSRPATNASGKKDSPGARAWSRGRASISSKQHSRSQSKDGDTNSVPSGAGSRRSSQTHQKTSDSEGNSKNQVPATPTAVPPTPSTAMSPQEATPEKTSPPPQPTEMTPAASNAEPAKNESRPTTQPSRPPTQPASRPATKASITSRASKDSHGVQFSDEVQTTPPRSAPRPASKPGSRAKSRDGTAKSGTNSHGDPFPHGLPSNAPVVLVIGAPGSNKEDFARRIAAKYDGFVYLSMGELLRKKVSESPNDELWTRIGRKMDQGEPVPMLLYKAIHEQGDRSWGYVIEGYPRTQAQATDFEQIERLDLALLIDCTEQFCIDNVKRRSEGGVANKNPRLDDSPEILRIRLNLFKQNTLPMLKYFDDNGKLRVVRSDEEVDGDNETDKIFQEITTAIDHSLFIEDNGSGKSLESSKNGSLGGGEAGNQPNDSAVHAAETTTTTDN